MGEKSNFRLVLRDVELLSVAETADISAAPCGEARRTILPIRHSKAGWNSALEPGWHGCCPGLNLVETAGRA